MDIQNSAEFIAGVRETRHPHNRVDTNHATLLAAYEAIARGDFEAFGSFLTADVELEIVGSGLFDGTAQGRAAVVEAVRQNFDSVQKQHPEIQATIGQGDFIAVLFQEQGESKHDGVAYAIRAVQWYSFADGKIRRIQQVVARV